MANEFLKKLVKQCWQAKKKPLKVETRKWAVGVGTRGSAGALRHKVGNSEGKVVMSCAHGWWGHHTRGNWTSLCRQLSTTSLRQTSQYAMKTNPDNTRSDSEGDKFQGSHGYVRIRWKWLVLLTSCIHTFHIPKSIVIANKLAWLLWLCWHNCT